MAAGCWPHWLEKTLCGNAFGAAGIPRSWLDVWIHRSKSTCICNAWELSATPAPEIIPGKLTDNVNTQECHEFPRRAVADSRWDRHWRGWASNFGNLCKICIIQVNINLLDASHKSNGRGEKFDEVANGWNY
jgi:hypothetical protein